MKKVLIFGTALSCFLLYLVSCTSSTTDGNIAGNGTRIGNPTIVGMIYQPDGKTPASNVTIFLRKKSSLPDIGLNKRKTDIAIVTTNSDGTFEIDSVGNGTYIIECNDGKDNCALYDSVEVESIDSTVNLPADTLKPAGVISGTIALPEGGNFGRVYVLVFGVQRFSIVDSSGNFNLDNLAEGRYNLRIISSLEHYESFDTALIPIFSGETTKIGIEMLFNGIPLAKNLALKQYDTLSHIVTLSWDKNDTSHILGYNVYRKQKYLLTQSLYLGLKNEEYQTNTSSFEKVNREPITDTIFRDLNALQNQTYTYVVTTIGIDSKESSTSNEISVTITTPFTADTLFENDFGDFLELKGNNPNKFLYSNGMFYIVADNEVRLYDTLLNRTGVWDNLPTRPFEIAADNSGRIYVSIANFNNNEIPKSITSIYVFNQNTITKRLNLTDTLDTIPALGIEATLFTVSNNGNIVFVKNTKDSIYICDSAGTLIRKIGGFKTGNTDGFDSRVYDGVTTLATDNNNNIYVYEVGYGIKVYDVSGVQVRSFETQYGQLVNKISVDPVNGNIYFVSGGLVIFTPDGQILTKFGPPNGEGHHVVFIGNKIYVLSGSYTYNMNTETITNTTSVIKLTNNLP